MDWKYLDEQMRQLSTRLRDDLNIGPSESNRLATTIVGEVALLSDDVRMRVRESSLISLDIRTEELIAFQAHMDTVHRSGPPHPSAVRATPCAHSEMHWRMQIGDTWPISPASSTGHAKVLIPQS